MAVALVFGGYSLVAALKDYKDWESDLTGGVQTLYTLAKRRGWPFERVHLTLVTLAAVSLLAPFPLLAWAGKLSPWAGVGSIPCIAVLAATMRRAPSEAGFNYALLAIDVYLAYLTGALLLSA